jgi:hypothetical protein
MRMCTRHYFLVVGYFEFLTKAWVDEKRLSL